jgi:hypothetical protein
VEGIRICCFDRLGCAEIARTECRKYRKIVHAYLKFSAIVIRYAQPRKVSSDSSSHMIPRYHSSKFKLASLKNYEIKLWMFTIYVFTISRIFRAKLEIQLEKKKDKPNINSIKKDNTQNDTIHIAICSFVSLNIFRI